eukprot:TRINITY_DN3320_c0_g1_i1.p2 TRINITY_DN3320_c0_g1~~TRINITY_DN3320_c0_g1_i1.p2  ORF type:complete len:128 (+),score=21.11 TRINITY_DN3320_c0_g1_i1:108-491(+)
MATSMKNGAMITTILEDMMIKDAQWELKYFYEKRGGIPGGEKYKAPWFPLPPHGRPPVTRPASAESSYSQKTRMSETARSVKTMGGRSRSSTALSTAGGMLATEARAVNRKSIGPRYPGCGRTLSVL